MHEDEPGAHPTLALSTKVEENFISPLTSVRGALEILRDYPELALQERQRFIDTALRGCGRLEQGIKQLAGTVYAAATQGEALPVPPPAEADGYAARIAFVEARETVEIDLAGFVFNSTKTVNAFYDVLDRLVAATGRHWYVLVNYRGCSVWPEAWIAFAHRGKKVNATYSLGTVRYAEPDAAGEPDPNLPQDGTVDPDFFESRDAALARIDAMRRAD